MAKANKNVKQGFSEAEVQGTFPCPLHIHKAVGINPDKTTRFEISCVRAKLNYLSETETREILDYIKSGKADEPEIDSSENKEAAVNNAEDDGYGMVSESAEKNTKDKRDNYYAERILNDIHVNDFLDNKENPISDPSERKDRYLNISICVVSVLRGYHEMLGGEKAKQGN